MPSPISLVKLFSDTFTIAETSEDIQVFEEKYVTKNLTIPSEKDLEDFFSSLPRGNSATFRIAFEGAEAIIFSYGTDFAIFSSAVNVAIAGNQGKDIVLRININKSFEDKRLTIYSLKAFETYLAGFTIQELLAFLSEQINFQNGIVFQVEEITFESWSASIGFVGAAWDGVPKFSMEMIDRQARLRTIKTSTHAILLSEKSLVPEDFLFLPELMGRLREIFDKLNFSMIIMTIFDLTSIDTNKLTFRLNGYKGIDGAVDLNSLNLKECISEYRSVHDWINRSGNFNDKLGLARNIISLHLNSSNDLMFSGSMYSSILSAYKVYEKQNIKQYIEIRNKLSDQLIDYNKRANTIVEGFASTFQKSALSVLTLFSSMVALKLLSTSTSENFVLYGSLFSFVILAVSLVYMVISRYDTFSQKDRYVSSYNNFKERYTDLLNSEDIEKILNSDKEFTEDILFIKSKIRNYTWLWITVLVLIASIVVYYLVNEKLIEIRTVMSNYPAL